VSICRVEPKFLLALTAAAVLLLSNEPAGFAKWCYIIALVFVLRNGVEVDSICLFEAEIMAIVMTS